MSYGHVYVASIAMQARSDQAIRAFQEAESFPGPALIIAHSPCIAHGYDLIHSHNNRGARSSAVPGHSIASIRAALLRESHLCNSMQGTRALPFACTWKKRLVFAWFNFATLNATSDW